MAKREPLPGWRKMTHPYRGWVYELRVRPFTLEAGPGVWRIGDATRLIESGVTTPADLRAAQLAAEDAARAIVAGQVDELGGAVVWPDSGKAEEDDHARLRAAVVEWANQRAAPGWNYVGYSGACDDLESLARELGLVGSGTE